MNMSHAALKSLCTAILAAWFPLLLSGCSFTGERDEALKESERWFGLVGQGKYEESAQLLHPGFLESTPKDSYTSMLKNYGKTYGNPVSHSLMSWSAQTGTGTVGGSRALVVLVFDVRSARGASVIKLTFTRTGDTDRPRILLISIEGALGDTPAPEKRTPSQKPEGIMI